MNLFLGIDLGTQSVKCVFLDAASRSVVASEQAPLDLIQRDDGTAEQRTSWWVGALTTALARVDERLRAATRAIGVSGQQHGFVPLDRSGEVLTAVKLWCDTSTERECAEIMERFGGRAACVGQAGNPILPGYTAPKVAWLKRHHPRRYEALHTILLPHDYLNFQLTGERCMEAGDASGTGFLDIRKREWCASMLAAIDPDRDLADCLPPLRRGSAMIGKVRSEAADALGLPAGIPVSTGGGDNMMAAIGTGNVNPGEMTLSLGTSGTVYAYSETPVIHPGGAIAAFCSSTGGWLPLLCTMNCTVTTDLFRGLLGSDTEAFEASVRRAPPGAGGLLTLPFFNGERTPDLPRAKGCLVGMDARNTTRENLMRSGLEGATFALRYGIDELRGLGIEAKAITLTGGGARSATWRQVVADVCNKPVTVYEQDEGAGFGAALQALAVLEGDGDEDLPEFCTQHLRRAEALCCEPSPNSVDLYDEAFDRYREAVDAVSALYGQPPEKTTGDP